MFSFFVRKDRLRAIPAAIFTVSVFAAAVSTAVLLFAACEHPGGVMRDADATLKSLAVDSGILSPAFSAFHSEYGVTVGNANEEITVTAMANSGMATVDGAGTKTLAVGSNAISVVVNAESGGSKTYRITVKRLDDSVIGIETAEEMAKIGADADYPPEGNYILMNDIRLENWSPICGGDGSAGTNKSTIGVGAFSGKFDGDDHTITLNNFDDKPVGSIYVYSELGTTMPSAGIVGQNQQNCVLRRSYSRAVISTSTGSSYGVGGITDLNASTLSDVTDSSWNEWKTKAVSACVALNPSVTAAAGNNIHRVISHQNGTRSNNHAWSGMMVIPN